jgi:hypothetical protein
MTFYTIFWTVGRTMYDTLHSTIWDKFIEKWHVIIPKHLETLAYKINSFKFTLELGGLIALYQ